TPAKTPPKRPERQRWLDQNTQEGRACATGGGIWRQRETTTGGDSKAVRCITRSFIGCMQNRKNLLVQSKQSAWTARAGNPSRSQIARSWLARFGIFDRIKPANFNFFACKKCV